MVAEILERADAAGLHLVAVRGTLTYAAPKAALDQSLREKITSARAYLLQILDRLQVEAVRWPTPRAFPLSVQQHMLWCFDQVHPGSCAYNMPSAFRINGPLDLGALEAACTDLACRHRSLRTVFVSEKGIPQQIIKVAQAVPVELVDLSGRDPASRPVALQHGLQACADTPFVLSEGPLFRCNLFRLNDTEHVLLITLHHIIGDIWSLSIAANELCSLYASYANRRNSSLPELLTQYTDYVAFEDSQRRQGAFRQAIEFWRKELNETLTNYDRGLSVEFECHAVSVALEETQGVLAALEKIAIEERATLFMLLAATFLLLLHAMTGARFVATGYPVANRPRREWESVIGFFVNTSVLKADFHEAGTFLDLLSQIRAACFRSYPHHSVPMPDVCRVGYSGGGAVRLPKAFFVLRDIPALPPQFEKTEVQPIEVACSVSTFDPLMILNAQGGRLRGSISCANGAAGYGASGMSALWSRIVREIAQNPKQKITDLLFEAH